MPQTKRTRTEKLLTMEEIQAVIHDLKTRLKYRDRAQRQLILFRLSTCCGLRVSEICALRLADVDIERMDLHVRNGKGNKARTVPLNWDGETLTDLQAWKESRRAAEAGDSDYFIATRDGGRLNRVDARESFRSACRIIDRDVTIHFGRHSYLSHALDQGRSIVEVQEAAGHSNVATTSTYLHQVRRDRTVGNLFSKK